MAIYNQCDALKVMLANMTDSLIIHVFIVANNIEKTVELYTKCSTQLGINIYEVCSKSIRTDHST